LISGIVSGSVFGICAGSVCGTGAGSVIGTSTGSMLGIEGFLSLMIAVYRVRLKTDARKLDHKVPFALSSISSSSKGTCEGSILSLAISVLNHAALSTSGNRLRANYYLGRWLRAALFF
jgi:hypothetical protein